MAPGGKTLFGIPLTDLKAVAHLFAEAGAVADQYERTGRITDDNLKYCIAVYQIMLEYFHRAERRGVIYGGIQHKLSHLAALAKFRNIDWDTVETL